jgi:CRP-like cAMP-binding protein
MFEGLSRKPLIVPALIHSEANLADTRLGAVSSLSAEEMIALQDCPARRQIVRSGVDLVREGERVDALIFLIEGWACQYITTCNGRRQISALLLPGDICDLDALLFQRLTCSIRMLSAGTVLAVPLDRVASVAANSPRISQAFTCIALAETAIFARRTLLLGRLSARERLAHLFCELAFRLGLTTSTGEVSFYMPLTQEQLADILGLTPVHVNRTMQQLRTEGLIASTKHMLSICDIAGLRQVSGFEAAYLEVQDGADRSRVSGSGDRPDAPLLAVNPFTA